MAIFDGFTESEFTHGFTHQVFRAGSGPAVIVIHEAPGLHPGVVEFAPRGPRVRVRGPRIRS